MRLFIFTLCGLISLNAQGTPPSPLEQQLAKTPTSMRIRIQLADQYTKQNQFDKVIEILNSYTDQLDAGGFLLLASAYSKRKEFREEVRVLNILATKEDSNYRWQMLLGQAYLKLAPTVTDIEANRDAMTKGIQALRQVLKINPRFKPAFDLLLTTFLQQKSNGEARELLIEGIDKFGRRPELFRELCRLDANDGFLDDALQNCRDSIKLSPNFPDHYVYLVQVLHDQKDDAQAERQIVGAAKRFPRSEFVQWAAGTLFLRKKNFPVAARYFETALKADPKVTRSHAGLATSLFESGREEEALPHFIAACKVDGNSTHEFLTAGTKLKHKGNTRLGEKFMHGANTCRNSGI